MNGEGRAILKKFGFEVPVKDRIFNYDGVGKINLNSLYGGARSGVSIQPTTVYSHLDCGPNPEGKLHGAHKIPKENFSESFERVSEELSKKGISKRNQLFAVCHTVPDEVTISGICVKVDEDGVGHLALDIADGVRRSGDFTPDLGIKDDIVGGKRIMQNRQIYGKAPDSMPSWANYFIFNILKEVNQFENGILGLEFVLDKELKKAIFHDFYWSRKNKILLVNAPVN